MCGCSKRRATQTYTWTSEPNEKGETTTLVYPSEVQAKAKVIRAGGAYVPTPA